MAPHKQNGNLRSDRGLPTCAGVSVDFLEMAMGSERYHTPMINCAYYSRPQIDEQYIPIYPY